METPTREFKFEVRADDGAPFVAHHAGYANYWQARGREEELRAKIQEMRDDGHQVIAYKVIG